MICQLHLNYEVRLKKKSFAPIEFRSGFVIDFLLCF